jgi:hypothetical protein
MIKKKYQERIGNKQKKEDEETQLLIKPEEPRCIMLKLCLDASLINESTGQLTFGSTYT